MSGTTASRPWRFWGRPRQGKHRRGHGRDGEDGGPAADGDRLRMDRSFLRGKECRRPGAGALCHLAPGGVSRVAALYESWTIPFVNLLMLPLGLVGAVTAVTLRVLPNDVYLQIGLLTTVGLSTKNAILIIQFIKAQMRQGHELVDATLMAVKIRLRPVIMTSLAFFFGTLPLALDQGGRRRSPERHRHRRNRRAALGDFYRPDLYSVFLCAGVPAV